MSTKFNTCIQVQSCVYMFKKFSKFNHNQCKFEKIQKIFQVQLQLNKVEKIPKNFKVQFKSTGFEKNSKNFQSSTRVRPEWKNFSFKVQMPGCEMPENLENILSQNQKWLNQEEKNSKFQIQNHWVKKSKNKFNVQTGWDIFKLFLNICNSTLKSIVNWEFCWFCWIFVASMFLTV